MNVTISKYDNKSDIVDGAPIKVKDYFSYINDSEKLEKAIKDNFHLFEYVKVNTAERFEVISYNLYKDENYADVIVMLNRTNFIFGTPYDIDIVLSSSEEYEKYFTKRINPNKDPEKDAFIRDISSNKMNEENNEKRTIIVPRVGSIDAAVSLLESHRTHITS